MKILTDAEYEQLAPVEQALYWRERFRVVDDDLAGQRRKVKHLEEVLFRIREVLQKA